MKKITVMQTVGMILLMTIFIGVMTGVSVAQPFQKQYNESTKGSRSIAIIEKVEHENSGFAVLVDVDKSDRCYTEGDTIAVTTKSSSDGFLYLLHIDNSGVETVLIPNEFQTDNKIKAYEPVVYPVPESKFIFRVAGPSFGKETIKAFVTKERLKSVDIAQFSRAPAKEITETFSNTIAAELSAKSIVVERKPENQKNDFATHTVFYETFSKETGTTASVTTKGDRYFVGFGIQKFKDSKINSLSACVADAKAMHELATKYLGVSEKNAALLTDSDVTLENVRKTFSDILPKITKPGDTVFVYWSGHGGRTSALKSDDATGSFAHFLVPYDGDLNKQRETMLMEGTFGQWVQKLDGRNLVFILDACHSKGMTNAKALTSGGKNADKKEESNDAPFTFAFKPLNRSKALGQTGLTVIASSASDELSFERKDGNLSVMTHFLIEAVKTGPKSMTHKEICSKIKEPVQKYMKDNYPDSQQTVLEQDDLNPAIVLKP